MPFHLVLACSLPSHRPRFTRVFPFPQTDFYHPNTCAPSKNLTFLVPLRLEVQGGRTNLERKSLKIEKGEIVTQAPALNKGNTRSESP
jgi:hypothetical protein